MLGGGGGQTGGNDNDTAAIGGGARGGGGGRCGRLEALTTTLYRLRGVTRWGRGGQTGGNDNDTAAMKLDQRCGRPEVTCVNVTAVLVMYPGRRIIIKTVTGGLSNKTVLSDQPFHATPPSFNKNTVP